ncbi:hypothetical protein BH09MYX1_BH09MYX1_63730 [soil metagenome]
MRRIVAIALSSLRLTLVRQRSPELESVTLAIVIARSDRKLQDERAILGSTRLDEVDPRAQHSGVVIGHTVAQARAKVPDLAVRVVHESDAQEALESLAETMLAFGATTSILRERDTILVDVTGCAHLHAPSAEDGIPGEIALAAQIAESVRALGYDGAIALADGPERAWACARFIAAQRPPSKTGTRALVIAPGDERPATAALTVAALRLDDATTDWLVRIGVRTLGDLVKLPRSSLAARLGPDARRVFALLDGREATPLVRFEPKEIISERVDLDYGAESIEPLLFVLKNLTVRVASRLAGRARSASKLDVVFGLDHALLPPGDTERLRTVSIPLPLALHRSDDLFTVLRARLERAAAFAAPVLSVTLLVPELVIREQKERSLFQAESRAETTLGPLVAELGALLGPDAVGKLVPVARWRAEERSRLVPFSAKDASFAGAAGKRRVLTAAREPLRWLPQAETCPEATPIAHLLRIESVEWWRSDAPLASDRLLAFVEGALVIVDVDARGAHLRSFAD